jgi:hypothetical protein
MVDSEMLPRRAAHAAGSRRVWFYKMRRDGEPAECGWVELGAAWGAAEAMTGRASLRVRKERLGRAVFVTQRLGEVRSVQLALALAGATTTTTEDGSRDGGRRRLAQRASKGRAESDELQGSCRAVLQQSIFGRLVVGRVDSRRRALLVCGLEDARRCGSPQLAVEICWR